MLHAETLLVRIEKKKIYEEGQFEEEQAAHRELVKKKLKALHDEIKEIMKGVYKIFGNDSDEVRPPPPPPPPLPPPPLPLPPLPLPLLRETPTGRCARRASWHVRALCASLFRRVGADQVLRAWKNLMSRTDKMVEDALRQTVKRSLQV